MGQYSKPKNEIRETEGEGEAKKFSLRIQLLQCSLLLQLFIFIFKHANQYNIQILVLLLMSLLYLSLGTYFRVVINSGQWGPFKSGAGSTTQREKVIIMTLSFSLKINKLYCIGGVHKHS
ncbi:hypothetical protein, unlikely [Trypanosoma brucei gambiense DAL972]|uniref:Uncharacterized protein n=1 Tax=Trypanosoma brucei gambiense (strain MHOM/CI/86/DAL972) TaxID=679716 RepID=C9ZS31_TRYB9|nr:hypothetical protein, unlikely [Trypanosoma brucei gambiense DAL972]CBH12167.1 hypothetical protein, unlikely [Trypanosoma brucei gambiense DAL972]|eukprot:XP_011774450.1 hypothetical protein, unlikely [Trypanosoma brucei gambiense DAL972]